MEISAHRNYQKVHSVFTQHLYRAGLCHYLVSEEPHSAIRNTYKQISLCMLRSRNILFTTYVEYVHGGKFFLKCSTQVTENWRQCRQHSLECLNIKLRKRHWNSKNKEKIYSTDLKSHRLDRPCVQYLLYGGHLPV